MPRAITKNEIMNSDMLGSFKQIRWALGLQRDFLAAATPAERPEIVSIIAARKDAAWWIDHRFRTVSELIEDFDAEQNDPFFRPRRGYDCDPALGMILDCTGESNW